MEQLIKTAQDNDILIVDMRMKGKQGAMSQCTDGMCIIAIDPHKVKSIADRKEKTVHELGHCMTGAFYDATCPVIPPWQMRTPCYSVGCDPHVHQKNAYKSDQKRPYRALAISRLLQRDRAFYERCPDLLRALQRRISITKSSLMRFFRIRELSLLKIYLPSYYA